MRDVSRRRFCQSLTRTNPERHCKYVLNELFDLRIISGRKADLTEVLVFASQSATYPSQPGERIERRAFVTRPCSPNPGRAEVREMGASGT